MQSLSDKSGSNNNSDCECEDPITTAIVGWDTNVDADFSKYGKNKAIIKLANKKINLINFIEKTLKLDFELTNSSSGWTHRTSCPFKDHQDNSPSFFCNSVDNIFKCWGCSRGGGPIYFLSVYYNKPLIIVAEEVLAKYGNLDDVYEEVLEEDDNIDQILIDFTNFIKKYIRNENNILRKFAEEICWSYDIYIENQFQNKASLNEENLLARINFLKRKIINYESYINNR